MVIWEPDCTNSLPRSINAVRHVWSESPYLDISAILTDICAGDIVARHNMGGPRRISGGSLKRLRVSSVRYAPASAADEINQKLRGIRNEKKWRIRL